MIQDQLFTCVLCSVLGTVFAAIGFPMLIDTIRFVRTAVRVQGKVVGYEQREGRKPDGPGSFVFEYPKVEFEDQHGNKHCCTLGVGLERQTYPEGSTLLLLFDARNPCDVRIHSLTELWQFPLFFTFAGLLGICMAIGVWFLPSS